VTRAGETKVGQLGAHAPRGNENKTVPSPWDQAGLGRWSRSLGRAPSKQMTGHVSLLRAAYREPRVMSSCVRACIQPAQVVLRTWLRVESLPNRREGWVGGQARLCMCILRSPGQQFAPEALLPVMLWKRVLDQEEGPQDVTVRPEAAPRRATQGYPSS
jgi:hypothetical protein